VIAKILTHLGASAAQAAAQSRDARADAASRWLSRTCRQTHAPGGKGWLGTQSLRGAAHEAKPAVNSGLAMLLNPEFEAADAPCEQSRSKRLWTMGRSTHRL